MTDMTDQEAQRLLSSLLDQAKTAGADAADAVLYSSVSQGVTWRLGKLEDVERSETTDLGLRCLVGKRQAVISTTDRSAEGLKELVERCVFMAKTAPEDPYCGLAPKERLATEIRDDLELDDGEEPSAEALAERAAACEDAALAVAGVTNSSGAGASVGRGSKWFATSAGFFKSHTGTSHSVSVSVQAEKDGAMERDYDYDSRRFLADLKGAAAVGTEAGERTVRRLGPRKMKSGKMPVVYDNRLAASLLRHLAGAVNGGAIARGVSFLKEKMGEQLFDPSITITDDPHVKRGAGSRAVDGEGVANGPVKLIDGGVLTTWLMNSAHARQLGLETSGHATRGAGGPPGAGTSNLTLPPSDVSFDDLIGDIDLGLLVTDMFGPQVNPNTGDYSVGCSGFAIEKGAVTYPVSEITIAGDLLTMFASLRPASDLFVRGATNAPSVRIEGMTVAGE
ncbi:MAG: TldD/PmbA family protein [Pseudomonadota bacterium]